jgi:hypothetical protein
MVPLSSPLFSHWSIPLIHVLPNLPQFGHCHLAALRAASNDRNNSGPLLIILYNAIKVFTRTS